ncbi:MAG: hypothetical protein AB7U98_06300 [Candidatus Nitrosocosmicus sp.]
MSISSLYIYRHSININFFIIIIIISKFWRIRTIIIHIILITKSIIQTCLSSYDEIGNITYDQQPNSINFTMPFSYDAQRIADPKNTVFIHQEVEIPKPSPLSAEGGYQGFTNGKDVTNVLMVEGNNKTKDVVHFMIAKPIVQQIANIYLQDSNNGTDGTMTFSLVPSKNGSMTSGGMTMNYTISVMTPM